MDAPEGRRRGRTFQSLHVRNFRIFIAGQLLSSIGTWMQGVAAPLLVLHLTHSGVALGIDTALTFLPILVAGGYGGLFADRYDNRRIQILTQIVYGILAFTLFALVRTHVIHVWMIYCISFLSGCVTAVDMPTRQSFYLELVGPDDLTNAMSLNTASFNGARIVGSVAGAALIAAYGAATAFLVNSLSYLLALGALLLIHTSELRPRRKVERHPGQIREGFRYAWETPALRLPFVVMGTVFLFAFNFSVLLPLLAVRNFHGSPGTYGRMLALMGAGSLVGALAMASRSSMANVRRLCVLGLVTGGVTLAVGVAPWLVLAYVELPLLGAAFIAFAITANSTLQLTSSDEMRGRVMALYTMVFLGSTPIGAPIAGFVGQHVNARAGLIGGGVIAVAAGLYGLASLRSLQPEAADTARTLEPVPAEPVAARPAE
ncbi:MAG TPA: MFS transporter [Actinobacteria bacterium]|nr:MFS transporter [Actinomycetota bacterium]